MNIYTNIFLKNNKKKCQKASKAFKNTIAMSQPPKSFLMYNSFNQYQNNIPNGNSIIINSQPRPIVYFRSPENQNMQKSPNFLSPPINIYQPIRNCTHSPFFKK